MPSFDLFAFDTFDVMRPTEIMSYEGWDSLGYIFGDGLDNIYAVHSESGNLYRYGNANGSGLVTAPTVIGHGGWNSLNRLCCGGPGMIYGVEKSTGNLLRYSNAHVGDAAGPTVIAQGDWNSSSILICDQADILYSVETASGNLLRYRGVATILEPPEVIGHGGWNDFIHLFGGPNGVIFGVKTSGQLVKYTDADTVADHLSNPVEYPGDWKHLLQVFASGMRIFGIGPGPVNATQELRSIELEFRDEVDKKYFDYNINQQVIYSHLNTFLQVPGMVNTISVTSLDDIRPWIVLRLGKKAIRLEQGTVSAAFRGLLSNGRSTYLQVYSNFFGNLDEGSEGLYFIGGGGFRGLLSVTYWVT